jgi:SAM-dependent methyltransferase
LPYPDSTFDAVVCFDANRPRVIAEWGRILAPAGGCFLPFDLKVLYVLAAPTTPASVREASDMRQASIALFRLHEWI